MFFWLSAGFRKALNQAELGRRRSLASEAWQPKLKPSAVVTALTVWTGNERRSRVMLRGSEWRNRWMHLHFIPIVVQQTVYHNTKVLLALLFCFWYCNYQFVNETFNGLLKFYPHICANSGNRVKHPLLKRKNKTQKDERKRSIANGRAMGKQKWTEG